MLMRQPRYFGMTVLQISSLAVMGLLDGLVLIAGAMVVMGSQGSLPRPEVAQRLPTPLPQPTATQPPTATPIPTPTPIPNWEMFVGDGASLWLPESYVGGDPATEREAITFQLQNLGSNFDQIAEIEQQFPQTPYALVAFDTQVGQATSPTTVQVSRESLESNPAITLDEYLNALLQKLPPDTRLADRRLETIRNSEAGRLFVEYRFTDLGLDLFRKRAIYAVRVGHTMWVVQYITERDDFQERWPVFESSIQTFTGR